MPRLSVVGVCLGWAVLILMVLPGGCGGKSDFGESVTIPQSRYRRLEGPLVAGTPLRLPAGQPFNVTDAQRRSEGPAKASSFAKATGSASCTVDVSEGGAGTAEFQLGHVLAYDADSPFKARITFNVAYECTVADLQPGYGVEPLGLKAYVLDSDRRMLGKALLVDTAAEGLPTRWTGTASPSFEVTFQPGLAYHFVVAGRVEASASEAPGSVVSVHVASLDIEITPGES